MSSSQEVLFLRIVNGEQKWFENGNEDCDADKIIMRHDHPQRYEHFLCCILG